MAAQSVALQHLDITADPAELAATLAEHGAVIVDGFLEPEQVERFNREVEIANANADPAMGNVYDFDFGFAAGGPADEALGAGADALDTANFVSGNTRNVTGLSTKLPSFVDDVLLHPTYQEICDRVLLPHCQNYLLNHSLMINVGPGGTAQPLHRDADVWSRAPGLGAGNDLMLASVIALVDFTDENGATRVVPGSHLWEGDAFGRGGRVPMLDDAVPAMMPAGSAVIYLGWTFHGAGHNVTGDVWRRGLHTSFCQGWLRTEENNTLATPPDVARSLPVRAQELLGYGVHTGLGMLELRSPIDQMRDGRL